MRNCQSFEEGNWWKALDLAMAILREEIEALTEKEKVLKKKGSGGERNRAILQA